MNRPQVLKFWEALENSTSVKEIISAFKNKPGYDNADTLQRYVKVYNGCWRLHRLAACNSH